MPLGKARSKTDPASLLPAWRAAWQPALASWSLFTKLAEPLWLLDRKSEKAEGLSGSFAMIRLTDHAVVISLRQVAEQGLGDLAREILAHEIGHHVYAPGDLADNTRMLARLRPGLPGLESQAAMVGNLYTDLLINDRLQRQADLHMAEVYQRLRPEKDAGRLWNLYMRIYEYLWSLPSDSLTRGELDDELRADAALGARLIRVYHMDWLEGAGRFAALVYPYLAEDADRSTKALSGLMDATRAGEGEEIPDGLAEIDEDEITGSLHPRDDPDLAGSAVGVPKRPAEDLKPGDGEERIGGEKRRYRGPSDYTELMKSAGVRIDPKQLVMRYYKELARRHLIPFPMRELPRSSDPLPEGLDPWDAAEPISNVDWMESMIRSPQVIPGVTTLQRSYGEVEGSDPARQPLDLYLGIDCSGSMRNPAVSLAWPILAGTVVALSALRAGAKVMACLSGEPGKFDQTDGFVRSEQAVLKLLTGYLGTGYAFGMGRLKDSILDAPPPKRPVHILVVSDSDLFHMLNQFPNGWAVARESRERAGGGATAVLNMPYRAAVEEDAVVKRLREECGWQVQMVSTEQELVAFARAFARRNYLRDGANRS